MAKRKTHRLSYYLSALKDPGLTCGQLDELLTDAAKQMPSVLSDSDYERIYWLVMSRM